MRRPVGEILEGLIGPPQVVGVVEGTCGTCDTLQGAGAGLQLKQVRIVTSEDLVNPERSGSTNRLQDGRRWDREMGARPRLLVLAGWGGPLLWRRRLRG